jgi:hypothetical protein
LTVEKQHTLASMAIRNSFAVSPASTQAPQGCAAAIGQLGGVKISATKNIGPLARFDDGKPDFLGRLRRSLKEENPIIPELVEYSATAPKKKLAAIQIDLPNALRRGLRKLRNENVGNRAESIYEKGRCEESLEAVLSDFRGRPANMAAWRIQCNRGDGVQIKT